MAAIEWTVIGPARARVGESPVWDAAQGVLYWVDAAGSTIHRYSPSRNAHEHWETPRPIGALALRGRDDAVLALEDGFYAFDFASGRCDAIARPEKDNARVRFNDGKCDRQGRFLAGTAIQAGAEGAPGALYRLNRDLSVDVLARDLMIVNGPCFSPDGATFYFADSLRHAIYRCAYDPATGSLGERHVLVDTKPYGSIPDGATVDADGFLWVALLETAQIARFAPDGRLDRLVQVPVRYPTSVMFGGATLDMLFVTSISHSLSGRFIDRTPNGGAVIAITGLGARGMSESHVAG